MKNKLLLMATMVATLTLGCKKDEDTPQPTPAPTKTELLTNKIWKLSAWTVTPAFDPNWTTTTGPVNNLYAVMLPCEADNIFQFSTNGSYTYEEGATKCSLTDPQIIDSGNWQWDLNQNTVILNQGTANQGELPISNLTATSFQSVDVYVENGTTYTFTETYTKQ